MMSSTTKFCAERMSHIQDSEGESHNWGIGDPAMDFQVLEVGPASSMSCALPRASQTAWRHARRRSRYRPNRVRRRAQRRRTNHTWPSGVTIRLRCIMSVLCSTPEALP
jgi:hypothetical protein